MGLLIISVFLIILKTTKMSKQSFKFCLILTILISDLSLCSNEAFDNGELKRNLSQVEVRAVFINCEPDEKFGTDSETTRFERQELFKHNALQNCSTKVAITVKMSTDSDQSLSDEYIPIDHVLEGPNKKRVRLLNPYVLRLRREAPLQAYELRRIDTVSGVLTNTKRNNKQKSRMSRGANSDLQDDMAMSLAAASVFTLEHDADRRQSYSVRVSNPELTQLALAAAADMKNPKDCDLTRMHTIPDSPTEGTTVAVSLNKRGHRQNNHVAVREAFPQSNISRETQNTIINENEQVELYDPNQNLDRETRNSNKDEDNFKSSEGSYEYGDRNANNNAKPTNRQRNSVSKSKHSLKSKLKKQINQHMRYKSKDIDEVDYDYDSSLDTSEKEFLVYEIGNPKVLHNVRVQLLEKTSTPETTYVWNDLTKGQQARVNAMETEWSNREMSLRYRPAEWVAREQFTLPAARAGARAGSLCLVVPLPLHDGGAGAGAGGDAGIDNDTESQNNEQFIIVPAEDLVGLDIDINKLTKRNNDSDFNNNPDNTDEDKRQHVEIRVTRALFRDKGDNFNITTSGSSSYLTMPYSKLYHAQIDLEVRADDNQLVLVGSEGSIHTIVADSTRKKRTILILQASNTGLASAQYRAVARDCGPELSGLLSEAGAGAGGGSGTGSEGLVAGPVLLPPRHTRRLRLELPGALPVDVAHCSVALLNDADESVAVRDVAIKKGDRCFCVWHCDCVCLSDDPKLVCREMSAPQQKAAGLPARARPRPARSVCYCDNFTVNLGVVIVGIILLLLALGLIKAIGGLLCPCLARLGLERLLKTPRQLHSYYESSLRDQPVIYDSEGWPIHPENKKRSVQLFSRSTTFMLNCIYFVALPSIMLCDVVKCSVKKLQTLSKQTKSTISSLSGTKKCFSSQDVQSMEWPERRRRPGLRQWMSPHADELTAQIWTGGGGGGGGGVPPGQDARAGRASCRKSGVMQPLLLNAQKSYANTDAQAQEAHSCGDSEPDDTNYVLTQMQKSRESLAKCQKTENDDGVRVPSSSSTRNLCRDKTTSKINKN